MERGLLARIALSVLCVVQAATTAAIDLNRTHATHPAWPGHARFHVVWQTIGVMLYSVVELGLIWFAGASAFYLACGLAAVSPVAFLVALAGRRTFGGTLSDAGGVPPAKVMFRGRQVLVDMNVVAVVVALVVLVVIAVLFRGSASGS